MGVPRLFPWIVKSFRNSVIHFQNGESFGEVDNLFLDSNGSLHTAAQRVFNYGQNKRLMDDYADFSVEEKRVKVFEMYFADVKNLSRIVRPKKRLYISLDGPAPLAKQAQQRQRRFVASAAASHDRKDDNSSSSQNTFSSNEITPGTVFMLELTKFIHTAIRKEMNNPKSPWHTIEVIFSPPNVPGEGEHKILDFMRTLPDAKNEKHCIHGPDADLIMLALSSHMPDIYLLREDQYTPGYYDVLNMGSIRKYLFPILNPNLLKTTPKTRRNLDDVSDDFVLLGFFVGNDFLPKIQMFMYLEDGLELMVATYAKMANSKTFLTNERHINFDVFLSFVQELSRREDIYIFDQNSAKLPDPKFKNVTLESCIYTKDNVSRLNMPKYREKYYQKSGLSTDDEIHQMCLDYIKSIIWVFDYYAKGLPSWSHFYPWHYAPLMCDLCDTMKDICADKTLLDNLYTFDIGEPSVPFVQLLSVLPPQSSYLLPKRDWMFDERFKRRTRSIRNISKTIQY